MPRAANPSANRTDMNVPPTISGPGQPNGVAQAQPIQVPTGGAYGEAQQLQQAQQSVPLPQAPEAQAPSSTFDMAAALQAAKGMTKPSLGALTGPTQRPNEPVTAGLPGSPVQPAAQRQTGNLSSMISAIAQSSNSPALSQLAARAAAAGQ